MIRSSSQKGLRHYLEASAGNSAYPDLLDELIIINREELRPVPVRPRHSSLSLAWNQTGISSAQAQLVDNRGSY
jgi:hypothetical protein